MYKPIDEVQDILASVILLTSTLVTLLVKEKFSPASNSHQPILCPLM